MNKKLFPFFGFLALFTFIGCGGAPTTSEEGNKEMKELEESPDYEAEMMGTTKED